jgi:WD40 repeat protein/formylglycine-generating enzyme required for sulfatase activity
MDKDDRLRVYISHSGDAKVADQIAQALSRAGIDTFVNTDISAGEQWTGRLAAAIRDADIVVVVLTASFAHSEWMAEEVRLAFEKRKRIIPIVHRSVELEDWPPELRDIHALRYEDEKSLALSLELLCAQLLRDQNNLKVTEKVKGTRSPSGRAGVQGEKPSLFIGYSRDDLSFVEQLHEALNRAGFMTAGDLRSIFAGEDWQRSLGALIRDADAIIFVLSPSSVTSRVMAWEVGEAARLGKRLVPVICRPLGNARPPPPLESLHSVFFYPEPSAPGSGWNDGLAHLVSALDVDFDWLREHTRYLQRAIEWNDRGRSESRLLSGTEVARAKAWVTKRHVGPPEVTPLQHEFLEASEAEDIRRKNLEMEERSETDEASKDEAEAQRMRSAEGARASREAALAREAASRRREARKARLVKWLIIALSAYVILQLVAIGIAAILHIYLETDLLAAAFAYIDVAVIGAIVMWRRVRPGLLWVLMTLCLPLSAALMVDAIRGHAMRVLPIHAAPITAMTVSDDESLLAVADQNGILGIARTESENLNFITIEEPARAAYFAPTYLKEELILVDNIGEFRVCGSITRLLTLKLRCEKIKIKQQSLQRQQQQQDQGTSDRISEWTYVASAMNRDGVVAAVRAGSRGDPNVDNTYEIRFLAHELDEELPSLELPFRPTAIAPYAGDITRTAMSEAASQPFLLGFENGTIGILWHDASRVSHLAMSAVRAEGPRLGPIVKLASSPGNRMATAQSKGGIVVWLLDEKSGRPVMQESLVLRERSSDAASGRELAVLRGHEDSVLRAVFSPDGKRIVTASFDNTARLWDAASGKELTVLRGHEDSVLRAVFSPDGKRIVTASYDNTARLWDAASGNQLTVLRGHKDIVNSAVFSPDGSRIATASNDKTARLWDAASGKQLTVLRGHKGVVYDAVFSPDGRRIATASDDRTAGLWDAASGEQLGVLQGHDDSVYSAVFSPDGKRIATASLDTTARLWDAASRKELAVLRGHEGPVYSAVFSPDGQRIVTASYDNTARLWDVASGKQLTVLRGHKDIVNSAVFSPDGSRIATASNDKTARLWDAATGSATLGGAPGPLCQGCIFVGIDESNKALETVDGFGRQAHFDLTSGRELDSNSLVQSPRGMLLADSKNHSLLDSLEDGTVKSNTLGDLPAHSALISHALFLKDGRVITAAIDGSVRIINPTISRTINVLDLGQDSLQFYSKLAGLMSEAMKQTPHVLSANRELALKPGDRFRECGKDCPEMVVVPAGEFLMGSAASEKGRNDREGPQHGVTIAKPFAISRFAVTFDEWDACVKVNGCPQGRASDAHWGRGTRPVIEVSWDDAKAYASWLSGMTGKTYRLLSEAEYEYAARAGTRTAYSWGDEIGKGNANCRGCGSQWDVKQTAPVGSFAPNPFGLYDMCGNVWQWVEDSWHDNYSGAPADGSPWLQGGDAGRHVVRGGSWNVDPANLRAAARDGAPSSGAYDRLGFRIGRTLEISQQRQTSHR